MTENPRKLPSFPAEDAAKQGDDVFVMPCSTAQQRFWLLERLSPGNTALNIPLAAEITGPLNIPILEEALDAIVQRHEILRTNFALVDGEPKQVIKNEVHLHLAIVNLGHTPPDQHDRLIEQEMITEAARPLSLAQAPVLRATLLRLTSERHVLMLTIHHIVCDGWSNGLLILEVGVFYDALLHKKPVKLPPLPLQYADYALWQQEWLKTPQFKKQLEYWQETLGGSLPILDFPTDHPRRAGQPYAAFIESLLLPTGLTHALKRLCVDLDITLFMVLFGTYVALLHRYTGHTQFIIGTTAANRNRPELENLIGLFANPLVLRPEISGEMTFRQFLTQLRDHSLSVFAHQEVPFEMILEEMQSNKKGASKPWIQTHFIYQKAFMQPATYDDVHIRPLRSVSPGSTFELTYGIVERAEGIRLQMEYNTTLFEKPTIRRLLLHFQTLLESIVENPDTPVSEMTLLSGEERTRLWPQLPARTDAIPAVDPAAVVLDLQRQLDAHFEKAATVHGAMIEPPPGAVLVALDSHLRQLPAGLMGEIYLGGVSSETAEGIKLVSGPVDSPSPIPLLQTKFMGKNREDGKVELWGLAHDFAQIGGFRANLRQIKANLLRHPEIVEAVVTVLQQPPEEDRIVCYVVVRPGTPPMEKELRASLKAEIGDYFLPAHILTVLSLPKNAQGEVAIDLLPKPGAQAKSAGDDHVTLGGILHQQLIEIWLDILKVPSLTIDDNFFTLGGSSLLALRMMTQVEKLCGRPMPLSLLLTGATIANLARHIVDTNRDSTLPLIALQPKGTRPPLFYLHGDWAGGGFYCNRIAQKLGEDQPFYVLPPYRNEEQKILSMEEMAAHHIAILRKQQPHGPYLLGGYCIGATVAMEMAQQLVRDGETVSHLFLVDPPAGGATWMQVSWHLVNLLGNAQGWSLQRKIDIYDRYCTSLARWLKRPLSRKLTSITRRLGIHVPPPTQQGIALVDSSGDDIEILDSLEYAIYFLAYRLYKLRPLSVPATLYFPQSVRPEIAAKKSRGSQLDPNKYDLEVLPGNHETCLSKHASVLAAKMKEALEKS